MNAITADPLLRRIAWFAGFVACTWAIGIVGGEFPPDPWYGSLHKPLTTPPDWVFAVAWPVIYVLMATSAWMIWDVDRRLRPAHALWVLQLLLNGLWPWLFFGEHRIDLALLVVVALMPVVAATMMAFWRIRPLAAALLAPYLAWLGYAAFLNAMFLALNG